MRNRKRIILVGKAASGKDYLASEFIKKGFRKDISKTTRPIRDGEVDGLTYHYISEEQFMKGVSNNEFYEHVKFNGWMYGTSMDDWNNAEVFIMTPGGINKINKSDRKDCVVTFIDIDESTRRKRIELRSDADNVERRIKADKKDFKGFIDYDYRITDPKFDAEEWITILNTASLYE